MSRRAVQLAIAGAAVLAACSGGGCYREMSRTDKGLYVPSYGSSRPSHDIYREDSKVVKPEKK